LIADCQRFISPEGVWANAIQIAREHLTIQSSSNRPIRVGLSSYCISVAEIIAIYGFIPKGLIERKRYGNQRILRDDRNGSNSSHIPFRGRIRRDSHLRGGEKSCR
jgi:hypothetical protein